MATVRFVTSPRGNVLEAVRGFFLSILQSIKRLKLIPAARAEKNAAPSHKAEENDIEA